MMGVTRLAPSPTGALHLGNARTFVVNWLLARQNGWRVQLRIDDLDGPRIKPGAERQAIDDLRWLGIDWDNGPVRQSDRSRSKAYDGALSRLRDNGNIYPCVCTRREVERAASAPHADDPNAVYPGTCRDRFIDAPDAIRKTGRSPSWRFKTTLGTVSFVDRFAGLNSYDPATAFGDFVVQKPDGTPAYQLAVVVDDHDAGVTEVVRGDDLLDSVPRQVKLYEALGWQDVPRYTHLPLVVGQDGRRLAKRHGDTRINSYRAAGVRPGRLLALIARWLNIDLDTPACTLDDLLPVFDLKHLPTAPVIFSEADDRWLRAEC